MSQHLSSKADFHDIANVRFCISDSRYRTEDKAPILNTWQRKISHRPQIFGTSTFGARCLNSRPGISPVA